MITWYDNTTFLRLFFDTFRKLTKLYLYKKLQYLQRLFFPADQIQKNTVKSLSGENLLYGETVTLFYTKFWLSKNLKSRGKMGQSCFAKTCLLR